MRLATLFLAFAATPLFAQLPATDETGLGNRAPITGRDMERAADRFAHRKAVDEAFAERPLRSAVLSDAAGDLLLGDYRVTPLDVAYGEFTTASGKYFVAMHFDAPASLVLPKDKKLTFFGMVKDKDLKTVWSFEDEVTLAESKSGAYFEQSFPFPADNVTGVFGFAVKGQPVAMSVVPMQLTAVPKNMRRVSRLLLSNEVFTLDKPQKPLDPFAFGGIKVVPKGSRAFRKSDELWVFFEAQNPAVAADGIPRLTTRVEIESLSPDNPKKVRGTPTPAEALPLKGVPGHFGVGTTVDINRLIAGDYRVRVTVSDTLAPATYELVETIKVVE